MNWDVVIGLEVHAQLQTASKLFSPAPNAAGATPNETASAVELGLPGTLPVPNAEAIRLALRFGAAIDAALATETIFARKNYFYPDLPKGYQISQLDAPIVGRGSLSVVMPDGATKAIGITRAHLEEDAGKSVHDAYSDRTAIDLNRAGTPLLEIVSEPELHSAQEAVAYLRELHNLVRTLEICDGNMNEGSLRCDANVSLKPAGSETLGTRTEIKNLNSFRFLERAITYEIERQQLVLEGGGAVVQETRLYDPDRDETRPMRSKEEAEDYRYFPDPDLLPILLTADDHAAARASLPELPAAKRARYETDLGLTASEARLLASERSTAAYFEAALAAGAAAKGVANWLSGEIAAQLNRSGETLDAFPIAPAQLAGLLARIDDGTLSSKLAKTVFERMLETREDADAIIEREGLKQVSDSGALEALVAEVIEANPGQVEQYRAGKGKVLGFFVGQLMKASGGKANPQQLNALLKAALGEPGEG